MTQDTPPGLEVVPVCCCSGLFRTLVFENDIVAEFAFGTSDKSPLGSPSEKGRIGNVHFALGDNKNAYPGGQNSSPLHLDGVLRNATLEIIEGGNGGYIFRDGQWDV